MLMGEQSMTSKGLDFQPDIGPAPVVEAVGYDPVRIRDVTIQFQVFLVFGFLPRLQQLDGMPIDPGAERVKYLRLHLSQVFPISFRNFPTHLLLLQVKSDFRFLWRKFRSNHKSIRPPEEPKIIPA
jgi:hypothetical protein